MFEDAFTRKDSPQFKARIKAMRVKSFSRMTYKELANEIGVHENTMIRWLTNEKDVTREVFVRIVEYIEYEAKRIGL